MKWGEAVDNSREREIRKKEIGKWKQEIKKAVVVVDNGYCITISAICPYSFSYGSPSAAGAWPLPIKPAKTIMVIK